MFLTIFFVTNVTKRLPTYLLKKRMIEEKYGIQNSQPLNFKPIQIEILINHYSFATITNFNFRITQFGSTNLTIFFPHSVTINPSIDKTNLTAFYKRKRKKRQIQ